MLHGKYWRKKIFEISGDDENKNQTFPDVSKTNKSSVQPNVNKSDEKPLLPEKASLQPENNLNAGEKGTKIGVKEDEKEESETDVKAQFLKLKESGNLLVKKVCCVDYFRFTSQPPCWCVRTKEFSLDCFVMFTNMAASSVVVLIINE